MDLLSRARGRVATSEWLQGALVAAFVFVVYALTRNADNFFNQYVYLADAFLDGRVHLDATLPFHELVIQGDRAALIHPPAPALFLLPVVAIWGTGADHVLVSCGVGALTAGAVWIAARRLWVNLRFVAAITVLIAFGTNYWWAAADGGLWTFAHVCAVFFATAALVEGLGRARPWLIAALLGLAGLSRLPVFLTVPFFAYLALRGDFRRTPNNYQRLAVFGAVLAAFALVVPLYNSLRYGTLGDVGFFDQQFLDEPWYARGIFDLTYIPRHIQAILFEAPVLTDGFPYFRPSSIGLALILTTPAYLYALLAKPTARNLAAIVAVALVAVPLVTHGTVGWTQFGYRFGLDFLPALLLLTASGMRERLHWRSLGVVAICVLVNAWGTLSFNVFDSIA